jgi:enoyl-CoA hydratase/carnithine racemase
MTTPQNTPAPLVLVERHEGYHIVRMSRPEKRNAMNRAARRALLHAFADAASEGARAVILTGTDASFCSGVDLKERSSDLAGGLPPEPESDWMEVVMAIRRHPAIFIAAVNGVAMGGGATLINVSDLAIAGEEAWISNPEMGFGAFAHFSGPSSQYQMLPKHVAWLLYTTERIDGKTAAAWGLVNECVPAESLLPRAMALATRIAAFDPVALTESKRALDTTPGVARDWRSAFEHGQGVNERIRARTTAQQAGLDRFAAGGRNPGQGQ